MDDSKEKIQKPRPYWHLDMKWIAALLSIPILGLTMLIANLYILTERENAVKVSSTILKAMYAPASQTGEKEIAEIRKAIKNNPDKVLKPFPGTDIQITEADLDKYSPDELKQNIFAKLAETIYDSSKSSETGISLKESFGKLGLMAIFTEEGHSQISMILIYTVLISIVLLAFLVYFSYGFGRFFSPGLIFMLTGLPMLLVLTILRKQPEAQTFATGEMNMQQGVTQFVSAIGPTISGLTAKNYLILVIVGTALVLVGIIGRIIQKAVLRRRRSGQETGINI